ncbi:MAG: homoserine O-acetyltransferase/O-succinyltransferase family protein, partial [Tissierella sp.]|uniref:homoserine O-acetyltransferase/O-succinyltransferase family protein n=1 Tax=Tissierella sp. TaxID=41274 RepID=UPI003F99A4B3
MPLIIDNDLPSKKILEDENLFIMGKDRATTQDIRPIKIAIVNLMPNKEETEIQLLRLLSNTPLQVDIDLIRTKTHNSKNTDETYLKRFYKDFSQIKDEKYDGMIITGAPVEKLDFEEVDYWPELREIFEYARTNVYSTMFICWAAQAALYHYYGIPKYIEDKKVFGVFEYDVLEESALTKGFDDVFYSPQSRHSINREEDVRKIEDLKIIGSRPDTGVSLARSLDNRFVFVSGHGEYDRDTLYKEYIRDKSKGLEIQTPVNYFKNDNEDEGIQVKWKSHGNLLFINWMNYCVYQETPYDINKIERKRVLKFGGSSLSDSNQYKKVKEIIYSEEGRNLVIVSAPGKRHKGDIKVTDLLIGYFECKYEDEKESLLKIIKGRFFNIVKDLKLDKSLLETIDKTIIEIRKSKNRDFVLSRGEYLSSIIMAEYLDFKFLDAKDIICFHIDGELDLETSYKRIRENLDTKKKYVIPGFYGIGFDNEIKTFERGGSDITGSLIAGAMKSDIYENW